MVDKVLRSQLVDLYPILTQIPAAQLDPVLDKAQIVKVKAGTLMWDESAKIQSFPFVIKGSARVIKLAVNGRELHLYSVGPGEGCVIATSSLVGNSASNARAIANENIEMVVLSNAEFKALVAQSEAFRDYVFADLSEHMSLLTQLISAVVFQNLDQRLAASLVAKPSPIQITHQGLADELGSVREIISRILKNFADRGWITLTRGQIAVVNPQDLKQFAAQN